MKSKILVSDARIVIRRLLNNVMQSYPDLDLFLLPDKEVGFGVCGLKDKRLFMQIGTLGLYQSDGIDFMLRPLENQLNLTRGLVCIFHECQHLKQRKSIYPSLSEEGFRYSITELAGWGNDSYYLRHRNYMNNLSELNAEKYGLIQTFDFLSENRRFKLSSEQVESMLLNYVNYRVEHSDYFVQPKNGVYTSFDDVIRDFEEAERQAPYQKREYMLLQSKEDLIFQMTCHCDHGRWGIRPEWEPYLDEFWSPKPGDMPVGLYQDMLIASMVNYAKPEAKNLYGALQHVDLSPEHVFGKSFPDLDIRTQDEMKGAYKQNLRMERLHSLEADLPFLQNLDDEISLEKSEDSLEFE